MRPVAAKEGLRPAWILRWIGEKKRLFEEKQGFTARLARLLPIVRCLSTPPGVYFIKCAKGV